MPISEKEIKFDLARRWNHRGGNDESGCHRRRGKNFFRVASRFSCSLFGLVDKLNLLLWGGNPEDCCITTTMFSHPFVSHILTPPRTHFLHNLCRPIQADYFFLPLQAMDFIIGFIKFTYFSTDFVSASFVVTSKTRFFDFFILAFNYLNFILTLLLGRRKS